MQGEPTFTRVYKTHIRKALAHLCPETRVPEEQRAELRHFLQTQSQKTTTIAEAKYIQYNSNPQIFHLWIVQASNND